MPPTMILIGVCACAGASGEAATAAKMAAARMLRIRRFLGKFFVGYLVDVPWGRGFHQGCFAAGSGTMRPTGKAESIWHFGGFAAAFCRCRPRPPQNDSNLTPSN